ncbi:conserved Plasmodium protein, unknown function [Plasmodium sp. gorilla clade G2]|uniref:conserved Plasmodium protein, unknown function n=1 Tax=Plasmodium sp. gorilla clade G2 TaxID=880535 RepID=UPI000D2026EF|nr:conserved Plasmodium protein, unknown function [Plasmodium sp. gorilla clade G2]SOV17647.1 conserved Plasmodium protein, unknown function [Plasmodium sp. gorilla clade G2]
MHDSFYNSNKLSGRVTNPRTSHFSYTQKYDDSLNSECKRSTITKCSSNINTPSIYNEQIIYHPNLVPRVSVISPYNPGIVQRKYNNCLNSFPCLHAPSKITDIPMNMKSNNQSSIRYINKSPCIYNNKEALLSDKFIPPYCNDNVLLVQKNMDHPHVANKVLIGSNRTLDNLPLTKKNKNINNNKNNNKNNNNNNNYSSSRSSSRDAKYPIGEKQTNMKQEFLVNEPFKKRITKANSHKTDMTNKINKLIKEKDEEIKKLEESIQTEMNLNKIEDDQNVDNQKLKEELLDQKTKYQETLKHLKKVETEKRNLKTSLNVRDRVLTKLEKEVSSVDHENELLLKLKENNATLDDVHHIFKYLYGNAKNLVENNIKETHKKDNKNNIYKVLYKSNLFNNNNNNFHERNSDNHINEHINSDDDNDIALKENKSIKNEHNYKKIKNSYDLDILKTTVVELEKEIIDLKEENKNVNFKYENTFQALSELRKDTLEYMESIVSRDMRIAYMESMLQKCEKDLSKLRDQYTKQQIINRQQVDKFTSEIKILEKQSSHLQSMIQEKDSQIVLLKKEIVRNDILIKQYEERNKELQNELRLMCSNLENVIEASNKKDLFMNELEKQIRENEVHRQHAYLKEVAKNRKIHADMKFKEILYDKSSKHQSDELHDLKKELYLNQIQMQKAKEAFQILKNVPKTETKIKHKCETNDIETSSFNNFSEYKNEKESENMTFETKDSTDAGTEYNIKNTTTKKKKKETKLSA